MTKIRALIAAALAALTLSACGSEPEESYYEPVASETVETVESTDMLALELAWEVFSEAEQADFCAEYDYDPELIVDLLVEGLIEEDVHLTHDEVESFLNGECR